MSRRADLTLARGIRQALALIDGPDPDALRVVDGVRDLLAAALELYERDAPLIAAEAGR